MHVRPKPDFSPSPDVYFYCSNTKYKYVHTYCRLGQNIGYCYLRLLFWVLGLLRSGVLRTGHFRYGYFLSPDICAPDFSDLVISSPETFPIQGLFLTWTFPLWTFPPPVKYLIWNFPHQDFLQSFLYTSLFF